MFDKLIYALQARRLSNLRAEYRSVLYHGFELVVDDLTFPALCERIAAWFQTDKTQYLARHVQRYITGFGTFDSRFAVRSQPTTEWVFFEAGQPLPASQQLLYRALRRSILIRYAQSGVPINRCNNRRRCSRATKTAEKLMDAAMTDHSV